jgi:hypothetical protein
MFLKVANMKSILLPLPHAFNNKIKPLNMSLCIAINSQKKLILIGSNLNEKESTRIAASKLPDSILESKSKQLSESGMEPQKGRLVSFKQAGAEI